MAKRKRLTPTPSAPAAPAPAQEAQTPPPGAKGWKGGWHGQSARPAPIADVAGAAATQAALEEVAGEMSAARREGRLVQQIALDAIDETHLVRDRIDVDATEMDALVSSLRSRGQQTPLEVVDIGKGRFGLISGWRRLVALRRLQGEGDGPGTALCLVRAPETATDAYIAMVEENEIRAGLSFYERARIAMRAAEQGAYPTGKIAVKGLFANAAAPKRSKIVSFLRLYEVLDGVLTFPSAISERLGLPLSKLLEDDAQAKRLQAELRAARPQTPEAELAILNAAIAADAPVSEPVAAPAPLPKAPAARPADAPEQPGVRMTHAKGRITLSGAGVDEALAEDLESWLEVRHKALSRY